MAYILNGTTLKSPTTFDRETIESSVKHNLLTGRTVKDIRNRKDRFILTFQYLSAAERNAIINIWQLETCVTFEVTETNLTIASTDVHVEIPERGYLKGGDYREFFTLILTEGV